MASLGCALEAETYLDDSKQREMLEALGDDSEVQDMMTSSFGQTFIKKPAKPPRRSKRHAPAHVVVDDPPSKRHARAHAVLAGREIRATKPDGNCLLHAVDVSSDLKIDIGESREAVASTLTCPGAPELFFNFSVDGENFAEESAYIRKRGNWFHSLHIGVLAYVLQKDIAVFDIHELSINLYDKQRQWRVLQNDQLQELMRSNHPPILITLDASTRGREHFSGTRSIDHD
jgi:hypothetical protein